MERNTALFQNRVFDVVVVGGGIHGACVARDAALRGLSVALVEQSDFCSATSHNSLKTIHGGIRYLQHLNFKRAIESIREQQIFLKHLPHLVQPLQFLMPTYGFGMRGPVAMGIGIGMFEALSAFVSLRDKRPLKWPQGRLMRAGSLLKLAPGIEQTSLTGGAIWADAQVAFADKTVLQMLQHAVDQGAVVANYIKAERLSFESVRHDRVNGIEAKDQRTGEIFTIKAQTVVNAAGPWVADWIADTDNSKLPLNVELVRSMNLVTNKPAPPTAIAVKSKRVSDSRIDKAQRMFFIVPWQGKAVIGTTHLDHRDSSVDVSIDQGEIDAFVEEFDAAYPAMGLKSDDVTYCYVGLTPGDDSSTTDGAKLHESKIVDHGDADGVSGLLSIISIKWTTARLVAERTVDQLLQNLGDRRACQTRHVSVPDYPDMPHDVHALSDEDLQAFVETHIVHTQAQHLDDIVLRRTNDLVLGKLGARQVSLILTTLANRFGWTADQQSDEIRRVLNRLCNSTYRQSLAAELTGTGS